MLRAVLLLVGFFGPFWVLLALGDRVPALSWPHAALLGGAWAIVLIAFDLWMTARTARRQRPVATWRAVNGAPD